MNPLTNHDLGIALHKEREAEFEQYNRLYLGDDHSESSPKRYRIVVGVSSVALGVLMIVQLFIG